MHYLVAYSFEDLVEWLLFGFACMTALTIFVGLAALVGRLDRLFLVLLALGKFSQLALKPHSIVDKSLYVGLLLFRLLHLLFLEAIKAIYDIWIVQKLTYTLLDGFLLELCAALESFLSRLDDLVKKR